MNCNSEAIEDIASWLQAKVAFISGITTATAIDTASCLHTSHYGESNC